MNRRFQYNRHNIENFNLQLNNGQIVRMQIKAQSTRCAMLYFVDDNEELCDIPPGIKLYERFHDIRHGVETAMRVPREMTQQVVLIPARDNFNQYAINIHSSFVLRYYDEDIMYISSVEEQVLSTPSNKLVPCQGTLAFAEFDDPPYVITKVDF